MHRCDGKVFERRVTPVFENGDHVGYALHLADITEMAKLVEERRRKSLELEQLTAEQARANAELEEYARQAEELSARSEQLRIARAIHDGSGHAITALHTISQMCLQLKDDEPDRFRPLIDEGLSLCESARTRRRPQKPASLSEILGKLERTSLFPVSVAVHGEQDTAFAASLHEVVADVRKEAYYNTLAHSLAESLSIMAEVRPDGLLLEIVDDGAFRGKLELEFDLSTMVEKARSTGGTIAFHAKEGEGFGITAEWQVMEDG